MRLLRMSVVFAVTLGVGGLRRGSPVANRRLRQPRSRRPAKKSGASTPWGKPDLEGTWDFRTVTPMERPAEFADKATLTEKEAAEYAKTTVEERNADTRKDTTSAESSTAPRKPKTSRSPTTISVGRGTKVSAPGAPR